jgi:hypothetical protein
VVKSANYVLYYWKRTTNLDHNLNHDVHGLSAELGAEIPCIAYRKVGPGSFIDWLAELIDLNENLGRL